MHTTQEVSLDRDPPPLTGPPDRDPPDRTPPDRAPPDRDPPHSDRDVPPLLTEISQKEHGTRQPDRK